MTPPKYALIAVTSASKPLHALDSPEPKNTGAFIAEVLHPFKVLREAGFQVDLISETGSYSPDWLSLTPDFLPEEDRKIYEDKNSEFRQKLDHLLKPSDVTDPTKYGVFFASAGHATLIDYPTATGLHKIGTAIYNNGGIISAVCHGGAIFPGMKDDKGVPLISGKKVTGFTTQGEEEEGVLPIIESWNAETIEKSAASCGATYVAPPGPWDSFAIADGRVVTGANPASAEATGEKIVEVFNTL